MKVLVDLSVVPCRGAMGIAGGLWRIETRAPAAAFFSIPSRRRAFCPGGGPSCILPDRRVAAVLQRRCPPSCAPRTFSGSL
jgi:hypothetical protein